MTYFKTLFPIKGCFCTFKKPKYQCWALAPLLAPLTGTEKGGAKVKNNGTVAVAQEKNGANLRHFQTKF